MSGGKREILTQELEHGSHPKSIIGDGDDDDSTKIPTKHRKSPLPPVNRDMPLQLNVSKKRKLQLQADHEDFEEQQSKVPLKTQKMSSNERTLSLSELHKPELTPPNSSAIYNTIDSPEGLPKSESTPVSKSVPKVELSIAELKRQDARLDMQIRRAKVKVESLKRAKQILQKTDVNKTSELIEKWRIAAGRASNYLLNAAVDKVNKIGGKQEFVRKEREKMKESLEYSIDNSFQDRIYDISHSEEFQELPETEQDRILDGLEKEQEKALSEAERTFMENEDDEVDEEFTMKDLYKRLKLDYKLVYPNAHE